jgi:hypothetical protein
MVSAKVRIRFRKAGDLRLISHHDLMRCWERMLRRAALPFHSTAGFNPKPRLIFALSLGLGIAGHREVAELELDEPLSADEVRDRLRRQAPAGLEILEAHSISPKTGGQVRRVTYRIEIPTGERGTIVPRVDEPASVDELDESNTKLGGLSSPARQSLPERITNLLALPECWVERLRPQPRRFDLRSYLSGLRMTAKVLEMDLWVTPTGSARPDEVLGLLGLGHLLANGAVLERTSVELHDEEPHSGGPNGGPDGSLAGATAGPTDLSGTDCPPSQKGDA